MARFIAKNVVAAKISKKCLIQLSYAIGVSDPISIYVETDLESKVDNQKLIQVIKKTLIYLHWELKNFSHLDIQYINQLQLMVTLEETLMKKRIFFVGESKYG